MSEQVVDILNLYPKNSLKKKTNFDLEKSSAIKFGNKIDKWTQSTGAR